MNGAKLCPLRFMPGGNFPFPTQDPHCVGEMCEWWHRLNHECVMISLSNSKSRLSYVHNDLETYQNEDEIEDYEFVEAEEIYEGTDE